MKIFCAWCKAFLGTKPGPEGLVTHSCCEDCANVLLAEVV